LELGGSRKLHGDEKKQVQAVPTTNSKTRLDTRQMLWNLMDSPFLSGDKCVIDPLTRCKWPEKPEAGLPDDLSNTPLEMTPLEKPEARIRPSGLTARGRSPAH
jgi:hypothetical protein